jgi:PAS domain S-box-containing protein
MISLLILVLRRMRKALRLAHQALTETSRSDQLKAEEIERRKAVAQTLKVTDAKMRAIVNSVQDVIIAIDQHGVITDINDSILAVFGYEPSELLGKNIRVLVGDEHRDKHDGYLENYVKTGEAHVIGMRRELFAVKKDGTRFPIELAVNDARVDSQILFTGIIRDITHRRKNEEQIAKAHKAAIESANLKSEFLANMSHEIRTPMNGVIGMTEMLLDSGLSPEQRNLTRTVHESAESLLVIINDILDFSKIEAGKLTIKPHPFRLVHTLEAVMDLLAEEASRKQVNLALFIDGDVPQELVSDAGRLRQILINLLGNALKFTEQGYVLLHLSRLADGSIHFDVKDSGSGIPEAAQATLFDAFSQVDGSSTREHGGTGLGLAICNQLVSLLGGELSVNSTLGEGSCFSFTIPGGPIDKDAQPFIQANQMSVLMYSTDVTLNRYHEHQMREWNIQPKIVTTLNQCFSQIEAQDYQMIAIDADNLYYDPEHALGALSLVRSIRQTTDTQIVLYGSMQSFMSLELVKLGDNVTLMQKPLKHSEIQLMVDQEQLSAQKTAQLKPQQVPVAPAPEVAPPATEVTASPIMFDLLLAEDNSVNQMVATTMLKKLGYQVDVVNNGREALDAIQEKQYDLIFMDCQMPVLDGYAATGEIRQLDGEQSKIPIIALTAHAMMSNDQKCFDAGMDDYLAKPVRINELKNVLLKWQPKMLERRKAREAETRSDG